MPSSLPSSLSTTTSSSSAAAASTTTTTTTALTSFIYAIKSPESQRLYLLRLRQFFDFLGLSGGSLEEQAETFLQKAKKDNGGSRWIQDAIISFVNYHRQRVQRKELAAGTLHNKYYVLKLFCEMNDDLITTTGINWKKISQLRNEIEDEKERDVIGQYGLYLTTNGSKPISPIPTSIPTT